MPLGARYPSILYEGRYVAEFFIKHKFDILQAMHLSTCGQTHQNQQFLQLTDSDGYKQFRFQVGSRVDCRV